MSNLAIKAIVTGASKGIGRSICIKMVHSRCYKVEVIGIVARTEGLLDQLKQELETDCTQIIPYGVDLNSDESVRCVVNDFIARHRNVDVLVNNAGYAEPASVFETTTENALKTFYTNVVTPLVLTRELLRHGVFPKKIINIASTAGMSPRPGWSVYGASKAALISLSLTLAAELSSYGIKVYSLSPGRCATELRQRLAPDEDQRLIMQPDDVAEVVDLLIADVSNLMDGQNIVVRKPVSEAKRRQ